MEAGPAFLGFTKETVSFLQRLRKNNARDWFEANRGVYTKHVLKPAKSFVSAMGPRLKRISPNIVAAPKVNKSIFRLNRDTRFSPDKSPYKPNLGIYFWEGPGARMESPGFYVHVEPPTFLLAAGYYVFPDWLIGPFRKAVVDPNQGKKLSAILKQLADSTDFKVSGQHYKRIPTGYDASHPNAGLLLHNGLHVWWETNIPEEFFMPDLVDYCFQKLEPLAPLHHWCVALLSRSSPPSPRVRFQ
jgi:uncharacterized protein (TIGR02453 family)